MNSPDISFAGKKDILVLIKKFGIHGPASVYAINRGVINDTYVVEIAETNQKYILQKLHKIFSYDLLYDFEAVTTHLASKGVVTPELIKAADGLPGLKEGEDVWRMMTYIPGRTLNIVNRGLAKSAGNFLAGFHAALSDIEYTFRHKIPGFHDPEMNIQKLEKTMSGNSETEKFIQLEEMAGFVIREYESKKNSIDELPVRAVHGDPKISNFIFNSDEDSALCLIDLDTVSNDHIVIDIGDALRSWCQVQEEGTQAFNKEIFSAFLQGYFLSSDFLTKQEISAIIDGVKIVTLDLCARYITDAFEEEYFKLDYSKYESLYEQNSKKASNLIRFFREIQNNEPQLIELVNSIASGGT